MVTGRGRGVLGSIGHLALGWAVAEVERRVGPLESLAQSVKDSGPLSGGDIGAHPANALANLQQRQSCGPCTDSLITPKHFTWLNASLLSVPLAIDDTTFDLEARIVIIDPRAKGSVLGRSDLSMSSRVVRQHRRGWCCCRPDEGWIAKTVG